MNPSENTSFITSLKRCILRPSLFNVVFVTLVLSVVVVVVPLILSIALFVSDKMESAGMKYATLVSAVAGERVGPFFRYPQQVLQYSQRAIASPMRSSSVGSGWFDPNGTLDNAAFWVGKFVRPNAGLLYSIYDNASLNSTFVYNRNLHAAADSTIPNNVIVERIGPPNITTGMNFGIDTIRSFDDLSHIVSNDNFSTVFDFRGRPAFYSTIAIPFTSPDSQIPKWFPPSLSFYKNSITMSIALPYYNASPPPTSTNSSSSDMPIGVQTVILFVNVVTKFMQNLSYGHTSLLQGSFALFEVSTRAFIGGNFNDGGLRFVNQTTNTTLSNGTVIFSTQNISRMASICEASDSLLQLACAEIGEDAIASCSPAPCSLMFRGNPPKGRFSSALMKSHSLLYVTEVRDDNINLSLRLVAVTDLNDVMDRVRDGLVSAVIASVVVAAALIIVASVAAYRSLAPLHKVEE
ncbi:membrane-associated protein, putative, partial [Bodo saltans]